MWELEQLATGKPQDCTPEAICIAVAKIFGVKKTEVGLLKLKGRLLRFIYPPELTTAGAIPLTSSAVAARTARSRRAELFNSFAQVEHSSVFEVVPLGNAGSEPEVIQKLMSAPVFSPHEDVIGVIQVSRKGQSPTAAGADFAPEDLEKLRSVGVSIGTLMSRGD